MPDILVLGGGFAGLWAALVARRTALDHGSDLSITMVSLDDHLTLRPRLFEPNPERFRVPLRPTLEAMDVAFIEGTVTDIDTDQRLVMLGECPECVQYDRLVLATGSIISPLALPGVEAAFNLDSWPAAMHFERHLKQDLATKAAPKIAIIGAGFTGIEIALNMRARIELASDEVTSRAAQIILLDHSDVIGPELGANPRPAIEAALAKAGIDVRLGVTIRAIDEHGLTLADGAVIEADSVVGATGAIASPLTKQIAAPRDKKGRLIVEPDLRVDGAPDVFATGDVAHAIVDDDENVAMMSCQHAMTMGRFAGYNSACDLIGLPTIPYRQERYVTCLDLGPSDAVFTTGWDRAVEMTGMEAKEIKRRINTELIYPPTGSRDQLLEAVAFFPQQSGS